MVKQGLKTFLRDEFCGNATKIINEVNLIAKELPEVIQNGYPNKINIIGFDVGIDRNSQELKIIEINGQPGFGNIVLSVIGTKIECWKYLYQNRDELVKTQIETL